MIFLFLFKGRKKRDNKIFCGIFKLQDEAVKKRWNLIYFSLKKKNCVKNFRDLNVISHSVLSGQESCTFLFSKIAKKWLSKIKDHFG